LVQYDVRSHRFVPYLSGIPIRKVGFSPASKWVTYITLDWQLWRSRPDGSERLQLTFFPLGIGHVRWSPDGTRIAFRGDLKEPGSARIYLISPDGGNPEPVTPKQYAADYPQWSPDGHLLAYSQDVAYPLGPECSIVQLDLGTRRTSEVPGSRGMEAEGFSPDGRYLAATTVDETKLMLFDVRARRWSELAHGNSLYDAYWSRDSKYIYFQDLAEGIEQPIFRVRVSDHKSEIVTSFTRLARADAMDYSLAGLALDDSPLASVVLGRGDIYALDVDFP